MEVNLHKIILHLPRGVFFQRKHANVPPILQRIPPFVEKRTTIYAQELQLEIRNDVVMFEENLHPFQRDNALS